MKVKIYFQDKFSEFLDVEFLGGKKFDFLFSEIGGQEFELPITPQVGMIINLNSFLNEFEISQDNVLLWDSLKDLDDIYLRIVHVIIHKEYLVLYTLFYDEDVSLDKEIEKFN